MAKHIDFKKYKISDNEDRKININGNKIIQYFAKQAYTDELSVRALPSGVKHYDWFSKCDEILDIGAGSGSSMNELKKKGKKVVGITCNYMEKSIAKQEYNLDLILADMHDIPFSDNFFDGIIMWDVLEHSIAPYIALSEAKRVLKDDGKILIYMPSKDWIECRYHYSVMNPRQMMFLLKRLGFEIAPTSMINTVTKEGIYKATKRKDFNEKEFNKKYHK